MSSSFSGPFLTFAVLVCMYTCCDGVSFLLSFISLAVFAEHLRQFTTSCPPTVDGECTTAQVQMYCIAGNDGKKKNCERLKIGIIAENICVKLHPQYV